ncbi:MAG: preprotein translocase subunit YajC [Saprospiraceae bacterium]|jgi:preprotein translocase subunit YajC
MENLNLLFPLLILAVFYFFLIRPQVKKQKDQTRFADGLERGDEVVTNSGIVGKIHKLDDQTLTLVTDGKTTLQMTRSAVSKEMTEAIYGKKEAGK